AEFEQAKREGKSASLLEEERPNVFTMSVANVMPGDKIEVELRYTELLVPTDGVYEVVYPTVVGPRYSNKSEASAGDDDKFVASAYTRTGKPASYAFGLTAHVKSGIPIAELAVPSHLVNIDRTSDGEANIALDPRDSNGGNRDFILRYKLAGGEIQSG